MPTTWILSAARIPPITTPMATVLELVGERVANRWLSDVTVHDATGQVQTDDLTQVQQALASYVFGPTVALGVTAVLNAIFGRVAARTGKSLDATVRLLFAVPATVTTAAAAAAHIAPIVLGWTPPASRTAGAGLSPQSGAAATPSKTPSSDDERTDAYDAFKEVLAAIAKEPTVASIADDLKKFGASTFGAAAVTPRDYSPERIIAEMRKLIERLAQRSPRADRLLAEFEREALELPSRLGFASAIAGVDVIDLRTKSPTLEIGNAVHARLRNDYRANYPLRTIVSEGRVYTPTSPGGVQLKQALKDIAPYRDYLIYRLSRFSIFSPARGNLRDDLVDFWAPLRWGYGEHWEIKPAGDAPAGVVQATWYRFAYNAWAIFGEDAMHWPLRTRQLAPGRVTELRAAGVLNPFQLPDDPSIQVVPLSSEQLGDLIVYWLVEVRGLLPEAIKAIQAALAAALASALAKAKKIFDDLGEIGDRAYAWIESHLGDIAAAVIIALVAYAIAVAIIAAFASGPPGWALAALAVVLIGGIITFVPPDDRRNISPLGFSTQPDPPTKIGRSDGARVTVNLGPCAAVNVPASALAKIRDAIGPIATDALPQLQQAFAQPNA